MRLTKTRIAIASAATLLIAGAAAAHHSTAMFVWGKEVKLPATATVDRWEWTNPHTFLYVTVAMPSGPEKWAFEGMSPNYLGRIGWSKRTLNAGEKVSLTYYALKDPRKGGFVVTVTLPNGQVMRQFGNPGDDPSKIQ
jgi:hypothetical protein